MSSGRAPASAAKGPVFHCVASEAQIMEAIWVAAEMRAGGAYAHSALAIDTMAGHKG